MKQTIKQVIELRKPIYLVYGIDKKSETERRFFYTETYLLAIVEIERDHNRDGIESLVLPLELAENLYFEPCEYVGGQSNYLGISFMNPEYETSYWNKEVLGWIKRKEELETERIKRKNAQKTESK